MVYGYATLGDLEDFVKKAKESALNTYNKALEDIEKAAKEMESLSEILPKGTIVWLWGKEIQVSRYISSFTHLEEGEYPDEEKFKELLAAGLGNLKKIQTSDGKAVDYTVNTPNGYKVQIKAIPPNCEVEEYEEIIPEKRVKKFRIKCDDGTITDLAGNPLEGIVEDS